ncbi:hypothetical protein EGR_01430 [Echinococcus granulosus]|uniref:Uncharacterized protein n=1 Tax=Echinococcus granulosus TaxID=6210 RepID=W6UYS1_ECHGR|nr:hypothetical protein EGR_01430 [Echinococcus granulosus]EUB63807.1 hypothetical protein EGR_01430 [Echinococcus granulosus]
MSFLNRLGLAALHFASHFWNFSFQNMVKWLKGCFFKTIMFKTTQQSCQEAAFKSNQSRCQVCLFHSLSKIVLFLLNASLLEITPFENFTFSDKGNLRK